MKVLSYIKKNYPVPIKEQLKHTELIQSDDLYIEGSSNIKDTSELSRVFSRLEPEDTLIVYSLKTLFVVNDLNQFVKKLTDLSIRFIALVEEVDTQKDSQFVWDLLTILNTQTECRSDHARLGTQLWRDGGGIVGRPAISKEKINEIQWLRQNGKYSYRDICRLCDVSIGTVQKYANDEALEESSKKKAVMTKKNLV